MFEQFAILDLGTPELIIILAIVLVLFGGKRLPQLSKSLADAVRELRRGFGEDLHENQPEPKKKPATRKKNAS